MSFSKAVKFLNSDPLSPLKTCSIKLRNRSLNFAIYGQGNASKVEYVGIYFHATPMCRLEPNLHSSGNNDNVYEKLNMRLYCFERPGFGESPLYTNRNVEEFVNDVAEALESGDIDLPLANMKVINIGYSAGGPYAIAFHKLFPQKVFSTAIIASSVSAHMDKVYGQSFRGKLESLFFSSPVVFQDAFHFASIQIFLFTIKAPIHLARSLQLLSSIGLTSSSKFLERIAVKLEAIRDVISESVRVYGAKGVTIDTTITQSLNTPWYKSDSDKQKLSGSLFPPIALYYSKDDATVPWSAGARLAEHLNLSEQPKFLDGGHACFYFNLDQILHDAIHLGREQCKLSVQILQ